LAGWAYVDENGNGLWDTAEAPVPGLKLALAEGSCPGGNLLAGTETDGSGRYRLSALAAGEYCVRAEAPIVDPASRSVSLAEAGKLDSVNFRTLVIPSATSSPPASSGSPTARAVEDAACRLGPDPDFPVVDYLMTGDASPILGRLPQVTWWLIVRPDGGGDCWIAADSVEVSGPALMAPLVVAPPLPTVTPHPGCLLFNPNLQKNLCVVPCPPDAQPGTACAP
jgi:hypothetical protein